MIQSIEFSAKKIKSAIPMLPNTGKFINRVFLLGRRFERVFVGGDGCFFWFIRSFLVYLLCFGEHNRKKLRNMKTRLVEDVFRKFRREKFTMLYQHKLWYTKYPLFFLIGLSSTILLSTSK